jgi:hypothetical protein
MFMMLAATLNNETATCGDVRLQAAVDLAATARHILFHVYGRPFLGDWRTYLGQILATVA